MIRKIMLVVAIMLVAGCGSMTLETSRSQRTDAKAALLVELVDGLSVGPVLSWERLTDLDDYGPEPTGVGLRAKVKASWAAILDDEAPEAPWPFHLAENITLEPYGTFELVDYVENDNISNLQPQYGIGTEIVLGGGLVIFSEWSTGDAQPDDTFVGLAYAHKF
jgi:hypothetical protein